MKYLKIKKDERVLTLIYEDRIYYSFLEDDKIPVGSIIHARISKIDKKLKLTFVDIGDKKHAFLAKKTKLKMGEDGLFIINKAPDNEKGYTLKEDLYIEGKYLDIYPMKSTIITDLDEYEKRVIKDFLGYGFRTKSDDFSSIKSEAVILKEKFDKIESKKNTLPIPKIVYKERNYSDRIIEELNLEMGNIDEITLAFFNSKKYFSEKIEIEGASLLVNSLPYIKVFDFNASLGRYDRVQKNRLEINKILFSLALEIINIRNFEGVILMDILKLEGIFKNEFLEFIKQFKIIENADITRLGMLEMTIKKRGSYTVDYEIIKDFIKNGKIL